MVDYYKILSLNSNATEEDIKIAYRKLSKKFHPDLNDGDKFFEDRFKEIQEAYEKLSDKEYRKAFSEFINQTKSKTETPNKDSDSRQKQSTSNTTNEQSKTKSSKLSQNVFISVLIIIVIGIIKVSLQDSIKKNALENIDSTYTPANSYKSSNDPNNSKNLNIGNLDSIPVYSPPDSTTVVDTPEEQMPSKNETEKWIIEKLTNYSKSYITCPSRDVISYGSSVHCTTYKDYSFVFKGDYLEIRYNYDDTRIDLVKIPIYDFNSILNNYSSISIFTKKDTMIETHSDDNTRKVTSIVTVGLNTDTETDLVKRLEKAFKHLTTYYSKPKTSEPF